MIYYHASEYHKFINDLWNKSFDDKNFFIGKRLDDIFDEYFLIKKYRDIYRSTEYFASNAQSKVKDCVIQNNNSKQFFHSDGFKTKELDAYITNDLNTIRIDFKVFEIEIPDKEYYNIQFYEEYNFLNLKKISDKLDIDCFPDFAKHQCARIDKKFIQRPLIDNEYYFGTIREIIGDLYFNFYFSDGSKTSTLPITVSKIIKK